MKLSNVTPVHKKRNRSEKGNYQPLSMLSNILKFFERCAYKKMSQYFEGIMSKYQCNNLDQGCMFRTLLTDLSKAFDCLPHDINIAKLYACRFDMKALHFIYDYLRNRKQ